ncbi:MAG: undecaprenyl-diphosphate phosphatase [Acidobacteria bacterium]|nr:undecaprenyl-diphosphate phosphatase [Acidobacteriota bacterium]
MTVFESIILGIIQGLTEFFPVSSSGHLVLGQDLLGIEIPGILFDVLVHVGTLASVVIVYRDRLWRLTLGAFGRGEDGAWPYILKLGLATVPAGIAGLTMKDFFEARFDDPVFAATMILVTGCLVWSSRWATGNKRLGPLELLPLVIAAALSLVGGTLVPFLAVLALQAVLMTVTRATAPKERHPEPTWIGALLMGIGQSLAILPGISRSGTTVITGLWRRIDPVAAAEFSFLMSIPAILGAAVLQVPDALREPLPVTTPALVFGFVAALISGIVAIRFFILLLKRQNFHLFAYYCWAAAGLFLIFR